MTNREKVYNMLNDTIIKSNMNSLEVKSCEQMIRRTEGQNRKLAKAYQEKNKSRIGAVLGSALSIIATGVVTISTGASLWAVGAALVMLGQSVYMLKVHNQVKSIRKEIAQNNSMIRMYDRTKWFLESYGQHLDNKRDELRTLYEQKQLTDEQIGKKLAEIENMDEKGQELKSMFADDYEATKQAIVQAEQEEQYQQA